MGDYSGTADVGAPAGQLFDFLSEITNLPRYFTAMTSAEPAGQDEVHVVADVDGVTREGRRGSGSTGNAGIWNGDPRDRTTITAISMSPVMAPRPR
jgi:carbon monoxide dehydrogenase subunit G